MCPANLGLAPFARGHVDGNIRVDPLLMDLAVIRGVVKRGRKPNSTLALWAQTDDALNGSFTERGIAHQYGALMVLQGTRHDFGGAGRSTIDQNNHRHVRQSGFRGGILAGAGHLGATAGRDDDLILFKEHVGHLDGRLE